LFEGRGRHIVKRRPNVQVDGDTAPTRKHINLQFIAEQRACNKVCIIIQRCFLYDRGLLIPAINPPIRLEHQPTFENSCMLLLRWHPLPHVSHHVCAESMPLGTPGRPADVFVMCSRSAAATAARVVSRPLIRSRKFTGVLSDQ
jgi:hypothetical protein